MLDMIALILAIVGGINWGLIGLFQFDLVAWIFGGQDALLSRINNHSPLSRSVTLNRPIFQRQYSFPTRKTFTCSATVKVTRNPAARRLSSAALSKNP